MGNYIWIFVAISFIAFLFNVFKNKICFLIWEISTLGFIAHFYLCKDWPFFALWLFYLFTNLYGYFEWQRQEKEDDSDL